MIVTENNLARVVETLCCFSTWVVDTETTGLRPYHGDTLFSVAIYAGSEWYYFNFIEYEGQDVPVLGSEILVELIQHPKRIIFHNAKFDMSMLRNVGVEIPAETVVYCTMTAERVVEGNKPDKGDFSLDVMSKKYGAIKLDTVEKYVKTHKLYVDERIPGKKRTFRRMFYNLVPFDIIAPYGGGDVLATATIYAKQMQRLEELRATRVAQQPDQKSVLKNEMDLLRVVWAMEQRGVKLDRKFCQEAISYYTEQIKKDETSFQTTTGKDFKPGSLLYKEIFAGEKWTYTAKGNPSFSSDVIDNFAGETAQIVKRIRYNKHLVDTYLGFEYQADEDGVIHTNFNQHLARTGRFSSSAPNLQNMEKPDEDALLEEFTPRRAIVPRQGHYFLMPDYDQMEYRMMLDYAGAHDLIVKVNEGMDVHQAMADKIGYPRKKVKNGNFAILYGSGDKNLATTIGGTLAEAQDLRRAIYSASPQIATFVNNVQNNTRRRSGRYTWNWLGRMFWFQDLSKLYKVPNALIQGGCADVVKRAMVEVERTHPGLMVLTIHDELVFEIPTGETNIVKSICKIMQDVYKPRNEMRLTVSPDWSDRSLADKKQWEWT